MRNYEDINMKRAFWICAFFHLFPALLIWADEPLPTFVDVTKDAGIDFVHSIGDDELSNIVESTGAGCAFFDYDNDDDLDIYLVNGTYLKEINHIRGRRLQGQLKNRLYRNEDGSFVDVTEQAGVGDEGFGMACVAADYDNDGDKDLFVSNYGANTLYQNNGDGTFADVTEEAGVMDERWGIGSVFFDYDNDGWLDLYVGNYLEFDPEYRYYYAADQFPGPLSYPGQQDVLYHNRGDGTFEIATEQAGLTNPEGRAMGVAACDYDNDGDMDLFVANDAMENYFYRNNGDGTFTNIALEATTAFGQNGEATSAMGPEFGDFNLDQLMDLMVPDMGYGCLYRNTGQGYFEEMSARLGMGEACGQYTSWGGNFFDFEHDGWIDIFLVNGHAHRLDTMEDLMLRNMKGERFVDVSKELGPDFQEKFVGRGSAVGDYDRDGDLDILVLNLNDRPRLLRNDGGNRKNWIQLKVRGQKSNRDGIGAVIHLTANEKTQIRNVVSASGYLSQGAMGAHFGLGDAESIDRIEIHWPSGSKQALEDVEANQVLHIEEPAS